MSGPTRRVVLAGGALLLVACHRPAPPATAATPTPVPAAQRVRDDSITALAAARADSARRRFTAGDVSFMTRMIGHHAQAIVMSRMAATHGASPSVRTLAERIINAQHDEIATMTRWLRARDLPVPVIDTTGAAAMGGHDMGDMGDMHDMPGMSHDSAAGMAMMPGMLTAAQLAALDAARGADFDRLFLSGMIQHHTGATTMVQEWLASWGAGQDEKVFKLANDIHVDQVTEIARMRRLLVTLGLEPRAR